VNYPIGHPHRRKEGLPLLLQKFETHVTRMFPEKQRSAIIKLCNDRARLASKPVHEFLDLLAI
jgi:2-methylcitrate dehydratase